MKSLYGTGYRFCYFIACFWNSSLFLLYKDFEQGTPVSLRIFGHMGTMGMKV